MKIDESVIDRMFETCNHQISDIMPSEWAEKNLFMTSLSSSRGGYLSYNNSPPNREIIDHLHPSSPYKIIVVKKGAQLGLTKTVVEPGIGWIISENPGNTLFLMGKENLFQEAVTSLEAMITSTKIRDKKLIHSNSSRANKKGDNDRSKEFSGGFLKMGPSDINALRQISLRYGLVDDMDIMKSKSKEAGALLPLLMQRFSSYNEVMKLMLLSSPELESNSNINDAYLMGDKRKYHIPCPCCSQLITIEWEIPSELSPNEKAGINYRLSEDGRLIEGSVGYICYKCGGFFDDSNKAEWLLEKGRGGSAEWIPTELNPIDKEIVSYEYNSLIGATFMYGWTAYVKRFLKACPPGQPIIEEDYQTFVNTVLGQTYSPQGISASADVLQKNIRPYEVGTVPEKLSISDGNGKIVLLTLGSDMNGTIFDANKGYKDDARLDWEIVAWSESGASYSIDHGSIGTFIPAHLRTDYYNQMDRKIFSYQHGVANSVWDELDEIKSRIFKTDTGRRLKIVSASVDTAPYTMYSYPYIDRSDGFVFGVKGDKMQDSGIIVDADYKPFKPAIERGKLWILNVNHIKDVLYTQMNLNWDQRVSDKQPSGFMNFPTPSDGKYLMSNYFSHFEAEHKIVDEKTNRFVWQKKQSNSQNHLWDCRQYAMMARDILADMVMKDAKIKNGTWQDFLRLILK